MHVCTAELNLCFLVGVRQLFFWRLGERYIRLRFSTRLSRIQFKQGVNVEFLERQMDTDPLRRIRDSRNGMHHDVMELQNPFGGDRFISSDAAISFPAGVGIVNADTFVIAPQDFNLPEQIRQRFGKRPQ